MKLHEEFRRIGRAGYPLLTPFLRDLYRTKMVARFGVGPLLRALVWYVKSREYTNLTYEISDKSKKYLSEFLASAFGVTGEEVFSYISEVEADGELKNHFSKHVLQTADRYFADLPIKYARRIGWYAVLRILKPRVVVESGIDRGVGTCVLAAAILRNEREGHGGKVFGLDINPLAGSYVTQPYAPVVQISYGDSLELLQGMERPIDVFIHDSRHSQEHERQELELVWPKLSECAALISDNAHATDCLYSFARRKSLFFGYWSEEVVGHIAQPAGIGLALRRSRQ